jgi:hypothetical protein
MLSPSRRFSQSPSRWLRALAAGAVAGGSVTAAWIALVGLVHCDDTATTSTYTPITGVEIQSAGLTYGHGCSDDPNDTNAVYRYAAVLSYVPESAVPAGYPSRYSASFECFADGYFENLPVLDGGNQSFQVQIAAWNAKDFPSALDPCTAEPDGSSASNDVCPAERVTFVMPYLDGGGMPGPDGASSAPTWTTTCSAYLQPGVPSIAACPPLVPFAASGEAPSDSGDVDEAGATVDAGSGDTGVDADAESSGG